MPEDKRILVIDDEEIVHASISRILARLGYEVVSVFTAREGLEEMATSDYDVVITDLMMPEMNGLEMLGEMKARNMDVPSIMVTGYPTIKSAIQSLRLGAVDYIPKPFTRQELLSPLNRALRRINHKIEEETADSGDTKERLTKATAIKPGDCFYLPEHSWAVYNEDNTVELGVESSFLSSLPPVETIETLTENELVEQGYTGIKIKASGEVHGVFMPLSGRVVSVNEEVIDNPASITVETWVLRIVPSHLEDEVEWLKRRPV